MAVLSAAWAQILFDARPPGTLCECRELLQKITGMGTRAESGKQAEGTSKHKGEGEG